jgi:acetoin:2,6-dichlorophenolindophenol oxidoreductase subunit beta
MQLGEEQRLAKLRMRQAIVAALRDEMRNDPAVVLLGEDVAEAEGVFKTSEGLLEEFGRERVRDTPISEMGFLGAGVGAAMTGLRPVVEIMFVEFLGVALDQLVTEAAKMRFLSGGELTVPLTVRASSGGGLGFGAQHSQTLETWLYATPGLKVAVASGPRSAYGLLRSAIRDDNPVVVLEPRVLYGDRDEVDASDAGIIPLGHAQTVRSGEDVTVVALGAMVSVAASALNRTAEWSGELIDLQTLVPWDKDTVLTSVRRTGRLVVVEENPLTGGWGTEIASHVGSHVFRYLRAPIMRITCPDVPVPFADELEARFLPTPDYVEQQVTALIKTGELPPHWWEEEL